VTVPDFLRGRRGAFIALGTVFGFIALILILPLMTLFEAQAEGKEESLRELAAYKTEEASRPMLEARLRALQQSAQSVPGLLTGSSAALAQAELQSDMKEMIDRSGGSLLSAQLLSPTRIKGFDDVAIEYDLTIPLSRVSALIYAIETHTPYFFLDTADLVMPPNWRPTNPRAQNPAMEVRWTVHAYRWGGSK
jgi:hypothetical protein